MLGAEEEREEEEASPVVRAPCWAPPPSPSASTPLLLLQEGLVSLYPSEQWSVHMGQWLVDAVENLVAVVEGQGGLPVGRCVPVGADGGRKPDLHCLLCTPEAAWPLQSGLLGLEHIQALYFEDHHRHSTPPQGGTPPFIGACSDYWLMLAQ